MNFILACPVCISVPLSPQSHPSEPRGFYLEAAFVSCCAQGLRVRIRLPLQRDFPSVALIPKPDVVSFSSLIKNYHKHIVGIKIPYCALECLLLRLLGQMRSGER